MVETSVTINSKTLTGTHVKRYKKSDTVHRLLYSDKAGVRN